MQATCEYGMSAATIIVAADIPYWQVCLHAKTRNILDCDQSNYSSRIILAHIPAKQLSWSWIR